MSIDLIHDWGMFLRAEYKQTELRERIFPLFMVPVYFQHFQLPYKFQLPLGTVYCQY